MILNALLDTFLPESEKCGNERVNRQYDSRSVPTGAKRPIWGLSPQMGRLAPVVKHTGQESGGKSCDIFKF